MKSILLFLSISLFVSKSVSSQCLAGEVALTMNIAVDAWGQETYWELVPTGSGCGNNTIASGSSTNVGCIGNDPIDDSGYIDNTVVSEGPFCLVIGESYDLIFVDSYGDGGLVFELLEDGSFSHNYVGGGDGNTWTFEAGNSGLPFNDSPCGASEIIPDGVAVEMTNSSAVIQLSEPHPAAGGCGIYGFWCDSDPNISNTVWAYFTAVDGVAYEITTCNDNPGFDTQLALYHTSTCNDFSTFELVSSNDDMQGGCATANGYSSLMYASCLIPGDIYYIQLDGWQGAVGTTLLSVSTYAGEVNMYSSVNNINCPLDKSEQPNGAITPYIVGSGADFTTTWTGPNNFTSNENYLTGLGPGTYNITVTSACGEIFTDQYQINQPSSWNVAGTGIGPDCATSGNGSVALTVSGATAPYTYAWVGPENFLSVAEDIADLDFGSYQITITDDHGCTLVQTYQLNPVNDLSFDLGADTTICLQDDVIVFGPVGLNYSWQDGSINQFYVIHAADWDLGPHALILTASTDDGCSYSDAYLFTVEVCDGVENENEELVSIFPNPATDHIILNFAHANSPINLNMYDASGRLVLSRNYNSGNNVWIDLDYPAGVYTLDIQSGNDRIRKQVMIVD